MDGGVLVQNSTKKQVIDFSNWNVNALSSQASIAPFLRFISPEHPDLYDVYRVEESNLDFKLRSISEFTLWQLNNIAMNEKIQQRRENFAILREEFGDLLPTGLDFKAETIPFGFPVYVKNRDAIQRQLSENCIFAPIHWKNKKTSYSKRQASHEETTLTIPCDHRYSNEDMEYVKSNLKRLLP
jgi:dTDP-4-amino-4,6-dideoxygalactose transaminase